MERFFKWTCFITSACMAVLFVLSLYIGTLLPDSFMVQEGGVLRLAEMPFLKVKQKEGASAVANMRKGNSYNTSLALGGVIPVKDVRAEVVSRRVVNVCGTPFGIKMFANGAMVVGFSDIYTATGYCNPAKNAGLKMGDVIQSIAGKSTKTNEDVASALQGLGGAPAEVHYMRSGVQKSCRITAVRDAAGGSWRTGMWVRDSSAGIGTLTFVDAASGTFAGLGHSIHDVDTGAALTLRKGEIVAVEITGAVSGTQGSPGELKGRFLSTIPMGVITINGETGVYGHASAALSDSATELAYAQEISAGAAEILTTIHGQTPQRYSVQIEKIALNAQNQNRNMIVHITDTRLLSATGGIVQGMSGSPILQNGRLVGAITHVLVNDPTRGYGIFAENMLKTADIARLGQYAA
ncbi:MAG: SpoIVB peptidase [Ruthenibacterium sp.]